MKSTGTCATNQYIKQINADGSVVCGNVPYHWGVTCMVGEYIERIGADGVPVCKKINSAISNKSCAEGEYIEGFDLNGNVICKSITLLGGDMTIIENSCLGDHSYGSNSNVRCYHQADGHTPNGPRLCPSGWTDMGINMEGFFSSGNNSYMGTVYRTCAYPKKYIVIKNSCLGDHSYGSNSKVRCYHQADGHTSNGPRPCPSGWTDMGINMKEFYSSGGSSYMGTIFRTCIKEP